MTRRDELLTVLVGWINEQGTKGSLPSQRKCYAICWARSFKICRSTFNVHWDKLVKEGKIQIHNSGAIYIPDSEWEYKGEFVM